MSEKENACEGGDKNPPNHFGVPIYFGNPFNVVGEAVVDNEFGPLVTALGKWFISDVRTPRPPRVVLRIKGMRVTTILLNRFVFLLSITPPENRLELTTNPQLLRTKISELQKIKTGPNPWDCRLSNLDGKLGSRSTITERIEGQFVIPPLRALPLTARPFSTVGDYPQSLEIPIENIIPENETILPDLSPQKSALEMLKEAESVDNSTPRSVRSLEIESENEDE